MGLKAKFSLVMFVTFLLGLGLAAAFSWQVVHENARNEVIQEARIMMAQATAIRSYTENEIGPLLAEQNKRRFLPQTIPFFAAETNLRALAQQFPDYSYAESALNPTNPADRASDWQADIINQFRADPKLSNLTTTRDTSSGPVLSISRPIVVSDKDCLTCHSTPQAAPASMIDLYGSANGFGWKLGDTIGAQIVSVPMRVALARANQVFMLYVAGLAAIFAVTLLLLNLLLHFVVVKPIRRISLLATEVSTGNTDVPEFDARGRDEVASLAASFNRMRRSLANAMKLLET